MYVVSGSVAAYDARSGHALWNTVPSNQDDAGEEGLFDDGGVIIGTASDDRLVAFAPWNYEAVIDRRSGKLLAFYDVVGQHPKKAPRLTRILPATSQYWTLEQSDDLKETDARTPDGTVAWRLVVDRAETGGLGPVDMPGGVLVPTVDGSVVALEDS